MKVDWEGKSQHCEGPTEGGCGRPAAGSVGHGQGGCVCSGGPRGTGAKPPGVLPGLRRRFGLPAFLRPPGVCGSSVQSVSRAETLRLCGRLSDREALSLLYLFIFSEKPRLSELRPKLLPY